MEPLHLNFDPLRNVSKLFSQRIGRQSYLIQRGLNLATFGGRQLDFRVLLAQKNHWELVHYFDGCTDRQQPSLCFQSSTEAEGQYEKHPKLSRNSNLSE